MGRKAKITFPEFGITVIGTFRDEAEPELCEQLWQMLPLTSLCVHTLSTGDFFLGRPRPPREAQRVGTQLRPAGRNKVPCLCETKPGEIAFSGTILLFTYGEKITEPLPGDGPTVIKIDPEYINDFYRAGSLVWNNHVDTHKLVTVVVSRMED